MADAAEEAVVLTASKAEEEEDKKDHGNKEEEEEEEEEDKNASKDVKDRLGSLKNSYGSTLSMMTDLNAELDVKQKELLGRVRKSVHIARGNSPYLRLASSDDGSGMKMVDMNDLLGLIKEETVKIEVQKEASKSKKMVENISKLLMSEGFL
jgi:hypothetical protein